MIHKKVIEKVELSLEKRIYKLEQKKENYCFRSNYEFEKCIDELYIYQSFLRTLKRLEASNEI